MTTGKKRVRRLRVAADINITPLIDVGSVSIDGIPVDNAFRSRLQTILNVRADTAILVQADETLPFQTVATVIDESRADSAARVGLLPERR